MKKTILFALPLLLAALTAFSEGPQSGPYYVPGSGTVSSNGIAAVGTLGNNITGTAGGLASGTVITGSVVFAAGASPFTNGVNGNGLTNVSARTAATATNSYSSSRNIVSWGNSLDSPTNSVQMTNTWWASFTNSPYVKLILNTTNLYNYSVPGITLSNQIQSYSTGPHLVSPAVTGIPGVIIIGGVENDLGNGYSTNNMFSFLTNAWGLARADGYKVLVRCSVYNTGWSQSIIQNWTNVMIFTTNNCGVLYDYIIRPDVGGEVTLDGLHWNGWYSQYVESCIESQLEKQNFGWQNPFTGAYCDGYNLSIPGAVTLASGSVNLNNSSGSNAGQLITYGGGTAGIYYSGGTINNTQVGWAHYSSILVGYAGTSGWEVNNNSHNASLITGDNGGNTVVIGSMSATNFYGNGTGLTSLNLSSVNTNAAPVNAITPTKWFPLTNNGIMYLVPGYQ